MKIYLIHSTKYDFKDELYNPIKESELIDKHDFIFLFDLTSHPDNTKGMIKSSDLVIAEVSYPTTGGGIELGWADAFNIPIICIHKKGQLGSKYATILTNKVIEYSSPEDMIEKLVKDLDS
jgi:hypothetical protein